MSFNDEQIAYMKELATIPAAERCWCAWFPLGKCPHCPPDKSLADRLKVQCPDPRCRNYPPPDMSRSIIHNIACKAVHTKQETKP